MMWKNIYAKISLAFLLCLTPVYLASCNQGSGNDSNLIQQQNSLDQINKDGEELGKLIDDFIREIKSIQDEEKKSFQSDNIIIINKKIQSIEDNIDLSKSVNLTENNTEKIQSIKQRIENIQKVTNPLTNGFSKNAVGKVQEDLEIFQTTSEQDKNYGKLNDITKEKISTYLTENKNNLIQDINNLLTNNLDLKDISLEQEVKELKQQVKEIKNNDKNFYWIAIISPAFSALCVLVSATLLSEKLDFLNRIKSNSQERKGGKRIDVASNIPNETQEPNCRDETKEIHSNLQELNDKVNQLEHRVNDWEKSHEKRNLIKRKLLPKHQLNSYTNTTNNEEIVRLPREIENQNQPSYAEQTPYSTTTEQTSLPIPTPNFLATYNNNPSSFSSNATEVNVTEETLNNLRSGSGQNIVLEAKHGGSYWIIKEGSYDYLIPKGNLNFNQQRYNSAQALFQCYGYQPSHKQKFHVKRAARVLSMSDNIWQLEEMGILEFY